MLPSELLQTGLTFGEIIQNLVANNTNIPKCALINDLGVMALENKEAETKLCELLLCEKGDNGRCAAYGFLSIIKSPDTETIAVLKEFKANSENDWIVKFADEINSKEPMKSLVY